MKSRLGALLALVGALLGAGLVFAAAASAHASVVSSNPVDGSRLKAAPATVSITFDESVGLGTIGYLHVIDQSGRRVDSGSAVHPNGQGSVIQATLKTGLGDGTYTESFRVISADSHPVAGTVRFIVGSGVLSAAAVNTSTTNHVTGLTFDAMRWVSYAGFALLGGVWVLLTVWPAGRDDRRARQVVWTGWGLTAIGAVAEVLLQGPYAAGEGLSKIANWPLLDGTLHTDYGQYHSARLLLLGALALVFGWVLQGGRERARIDDSVWLLGGGVALTFSAVGHAATTHPDPLSIATDLLHIGAMAAWVGGLVMLLAGVLPRREPDELRTVLPVFSKVAFTSVVVMAVTGGYAAWRGVGTIHAIFTTTYGLLVVVKVALFIGLLALGNTSRRVVQRRFASLPVAHAFADTAVIPAPVEEPPSTERLRRAVIVEVVLALVVLAATGALVAEPRGKEALAIAHQKSVSASAALSASRSVTVSVDPGTHGDVTVSVQLSDGIKPVSVTGTATLASKDIGPIPLGLVANGTSAQGASLYAASGVNLPAAGRWTFALVVTTSQFVATTTDVTIRLY